MYTIKCIPIGYNFFWNNIDLLNNLIRLKKFNIIKKLERFELVRKIINPINKQNINMRVSCNKGYCNVY